MAILKIYTGYVLGGVMISRTLFGTTPDGLPAYTYTLAAGSQEVVLTDFGAAITSIFIPDATGKKSDIVLGFDKLEDYFDNPACYGMTVGPSANRTDKAEVPLAGHIYHLPKTMDLQSKTTFTLTLNTVCTNVFGTPKLTKIQIPSYLASVLTTAPLVFPATALYTHAIRLKKYPKEPSFFSPIAAPQICQRWSI